MKARRWIDLKVNTGISAVIEEISDKYYLNQTYFGCISLSADEVFVFFQNLALEFSNLKGLYIQDSIRKRNLYIDFIPDFIDNAEPSAAFREILKSAEFQFLEYVTDGFETKPERGEISIWFRMNALHPEETAHRIKLVDSFKRNFADQNVSNNVKD